MMSEFGSALIVGAGDGLSASLARLLAAEGLRVGLAARNVDKLRELARATGAVTVACDASDPAQVAALFATMDEQLGGPPDIVVYNASARARGPLVDLDPAAVSQALQVGAFGGFLVAQQAARRMLPRGHGAILFTGASASVKGYKLSAPFAMAKFALRGLAQSMARELAPQGIHVAHFVIDGAIRNPGRTESHPDSMLDPDAIARSLPADHPAGSQRLDLGGRAAAVGGDLLSARASAPAAEPGRDRSDCSSEQPSSGLAWRQSGDRVPAAVATLGHGPPPLPAPADARRLG